MKTYKISLLLIFIIFTISSYSQDVLKFNHKIAFDSSKKKKAYKEISEWANSQPYFKINYTNNNDTIKGVGTINFINQVKYDASLTYSRLYTSQTNGKIEYNILIIIDNNEINLFLNNFKHIPSSKNEKIEFGLLTNCTNAPEYLLSDYDSAWCNKVWNSMKTLATDNSQIIISLIPSSLISAK